MLIIKIFRDVDFIEDPCDNTSLSLSYRLFFRQMKQILSIFILIGFTVILSKQARCIERVNKRFVLHVPNENKVNTDMIKRKYKGKNVLVFFSGFTFI